MCYEPLIAVFSGRKKEGITCRGIQISRHRKFFFISVKALLQEHFTCHVKHFQHFQLHSFASFEPSFLIGVAHAVQDTGGRLDTFSGCFSYIHLQ